MKNFLKLIVCGCFLFVEASDGFAQNLKSKIHASVDDIVLNTTYPKQLTDEITRQQKIASTNPEYANQEYIDYLTHLKKELDAKRLSAREAEQLQLKFLKNQLSQVLSKLPPKDEAPSDMKPILEMFEKMAED